MSKKLKKILIAIAGVLAVLFVVAFVLYKVFVTPEVKVALTLINAKEDISRSFDFYVDDNEKNIINFVSKETGVSEYKMKIDKSPLFEGSDITLITTGNKKASVSEAKINRLITLDVYADDSDILINLPLFNGGLQIPLKATAEEWNGSVFSEAYNSLPHNENKNSFLNAEPNDFSVLDFITASKTELIDFIRQTDIKTQKSDTVKIGDKDKKADVYLLDFTEDDMKTLSDIITKYLEKENLTTTTDITELLTGVAKENKVYLKIRNYNLYEIEIAGKENYTLAFSDNKNQFDNITYYKNDKAEISRQKTTDKDKKTDILQKNGKTVLELERDATNSSLTFNDGKTSVEMTGSGMTLTEDKIAYDDLTIKIGDHFTVSGEYSLEKRMSQEHVTFNKSGTYLDVTKLPLNEWNAISDSLTGFLNNIPFF